MANRVFTASQTAQAVDWLFKCGGKFSITLKGDRHWPALSSCKEHKKMGKEKTETYINAAISINTSRYDYDINDIRIVIEEPEINELLEDF